MGDILQFTEKINIGRCKYILSLHKETFKNIVWKKDSMDKDGNKCKFETYWRQVRKYCERAILENGVLKHEYKYATNTNGKGRIFVKGFGVQSLQKRLRGFLCGEYYTDVDMVNCHPVMYLYLGK